MNRKNQKNTALGIYELQGFAGAFECTKLRSKKYKSSYADCNHRNCHPEALSALDTCSKAKTYNASIHWNAMKNLFAQTNPNTLGALEKTPSFFGA